MQSPNTPRGSERRFEPSPPRLRGNLTPSDGSSPRPERAPRQTSRPRCGAQEADDATAAGDSPRLLLSFQQHSRAVTLELRSRLEDVERVVEAACSRLDSRIQAGFAELGETSRECRALLVDAARPPAPMTALASGSDVRPRSAEAHPILHSGRPRGPTFVEEVASERSPGVDEPLCGLWPPPTASQSVDGVQSDPSSFAGEPAVGGARTMGTARTLSGAKRCKVDEIWASPALTVPVSEATQVSGETQGAGPSLSVADEVEEHDHAGKLRFLVGHAIYQSLGAPSEDSWGHLLASSWLFHALGLFLTLLHCAVVGVEVSSKTSSALGVAAGRPRAEGLDDVLEVCLVMRRGFLGWSVIEVLVHFLGDRADYFLGPERWWNFFDLAVVLLSLFEFVASGPDMSFIRFLRIARASRAVQAIRAVRYSPSLQKMLTNIGAVAGSLFWAACLLFVLIYMAGVLMMEGLVVFVQDELVGTLAQGPYDSLTLFAGAGGADLLRDLQAYYGSLGRTFATLFRAISGADWSAFAAPLAATGWGWGVVWLAYIFFASLGMLNIVTGVVVDILKKPVPNERLLQLNLEAQEARKVWRIFADELARLGRHDPKDTLSGARFTAFVSRPVVARRLHEFGIDLERFTDVFHLIDKEHNGALTAEQAAWGVLRLRDEAKASELAAVERGLRSLARDLKDVGHDVGWLRHQATLGVGGREEEEKEEEEEGQESFQM